MVITLVWEKNLKIEEHHGVSILSLNLVLPDHEKQVEGTENEKKVSGYQFSASKAETERRK